MEYHHDNMFSNFPNSVGSSMEIATPTYDQITIKPPDRNKTHGQRAKRLIVDSRERDMELHPDPSQYVLHLENEYRDVISVELSQANIPNSFYNIYHEVHQNGILYANNFLHLHMITQDNGDMSTIFELPSGKYTDLSILKTNLNILLTSTINPHVNPYLKFNPISINSLTNKLEITLVPYINEFSKVSSLYFEFLDPNTCPTLNPNVQEKKEYPKHSVGSILGFNKKNVGQLQGFISGTKNDKNIKGYLTDFVNDLPKYKEDYPKLLINSNNITYTVEIECVVNKTDLILTQPFPGDTFINSIFFSQVIISPNVLDIECDKYIILDIHELHRLKSNTDSIENRFVVIPIDYSKCSTKLNLGSIPTQREIKYFNPPFANLAKMRIAFYRYNGDPLFFNGVNHLLDFNITALNQAGKYNNINSGTINN
jgi:hypothetical protein